MLQAIKTAFDKGRKPTPDDVMAITAQLDKVAAAVAAGRHATATTGKCNHNLTDFQTEEDGFFCRMASSAMLAGKWWGSAPG